MTVAGIWKPEVIKPSEEFVTSDGGQLVVGTTTVLRRDLVLALHATRRHGNENGEA